MHVTLYMSEGNASELHFRTFSEITIDFPEMIQGTIWPASAQEIIKFLDAIMERNRNVIIITLSEVVLCYFQKQIRDGKMQSQDLELRILTGEKFSSVTFDYKGEFIEPLPIKLDSEVLFHLRFNT